MSQHGPHGQHEVKEPIGWMDKPETVKRLFTIFYVICGLLVLAELLIIGAPNEHATPLEERMRFLVYPVYGFVSFWFLVLVARPMRKLLIRSEDYYEGGGRYEEDGHD
ncbi:MAG: hypothetical protein PVJ80_00190 [Gemmatimonadota bacterium]|jgi:hypothetical protein